MTRCASYPPAMAVSIKFCIHHTVLNFSDAFTHQTAMHFTILIMPKLLQYVHSTQNTMKTAFISYCKAFSSSHSHCIKFSNMNSCLFVTGKIHSTCSLSKHRILLHVDLLHERPIAHGNLLHHASFHVDLMHGAILHADLLR